MATQDRGATVFRLEKSQHVGCGRDGAEEGRGPLTWTQAWAHEPPSLGKREGRVMAQGGGGGG